jgi:hypothetical protein
MDQVARRNAQPSGNTDFTSTLNSACDHQQHGGARDQEESDNNGYVGHDRGQVKHLGSPQGRAGPQLSFNEMRKQSLCVTRFQLTVVIEHRV